MSDPMGTALACAGLYPGSNKKGVMDLHKKSPKKLLALLLAVTLLFCLMPVQALATETDEVAKVTVYFSRSHDDKFEIGENSDVVMALQKITVPYFDLALYGLQDYYFSSETYTGNEDYDGTGQPDSNLEPGTAEFAYNKVTLMHLFIYVTEIYYCGIEEEDAGQGYLYNQKLIETDTFMLTGSVGSTYLKMFWGQDENLNYYVNYNYPLASPGWGSTADQILLREGDVITMGHFSSWEFHTDPGMVFNYLKAGSDTVTTTVDLGQKLELSAWLAGADDSGAYTTGHTIVESEPEIYYSKMDELFEGDVNSWTLAGVADRNGRLTFDTANLEPGEYIFAMAGQYGVNLKEEIVSAPGAIRVTVVKRGDLTGDGKINVMDAARLYQAVKGKATLTEFQTAAADMNKDGKLNVMDAAQLYKLLKQ